MPNNSKRVQKVIDSGFLDKIGESKDKFEFIIAGSILEQYGNDFVDLLTKYIKERKVSASGALADNIIPEINEEGNKLTITMLDYYDFVNEGVKGWGDSRNAPNSPYRYKSKGMNKEGRLSIKHYIQSGKLKVRNTLKDKAKGFKSESKGIRFSQKKTLIDRQVNTMVWLIKKYGIKNTDYFTDAFEKAFANLEIDIANSLQKNVEIYIDLINKKRY